MTVVVRDRREATTPIELATSLPIFQHTGRLPSLTPRQRGMRGCLNSQVIDGKPRNMTAFPLCSADPVRHELRVATAVPLRSPVAPRGAVVFALR
jgi:hypothetical protein